ncbi:23S ribosomal RNA methyltransferase Erm [Agaribacter marinus]|uniref:rRNA adenine N-6-methyltransferase n=1 Tax=Virgibacillus salarius TaxID=447199 RepID=A0A941DYZ3_9BACI|nr:23S ribosomal RNA methyltransferase Erm [Virgibacillus salarius]MBR7795938.1 23S ribosomal RNA methyltransferase Erm [Virgibacillus salarius]NAZ08650.1 23S ribosomal RNA methyltransferase Erm [Agaribacter marinus]WBX78689.1 23S ribosomal RNA methyltransferase Erm [Virgibacillus salarius]
MARSRKRYQHKKSSTGTPSNFSGKHFIHNKRLINDIVNIARISKSDLVLDLGAGKGAITSILSSRARKVLAIEYDSNFIKKLKQLEMKNTIIIKQDILRISLPQEPFVVVSNIPYAITTPIMKMFLNKPSSGFQSGVIVMENGVAKRFTSNFVKESYVIAWKMWFDIQYVKGISRRNFSPPPKVDSAVIKINRKAKPIVPISDYLIFWGLADYALKHPQYTIEIALKGIFTPPQMKHLKRNLQINNETPVASLTELQWGSLFETMIKYVPKSRWPKIKKAKLNHF